MPLFPKIFIVHIYRYISHCTFHKKDRNLLLNVLKYTKRLPADLLKKGNLI